MYPTEDKECTTFPAHGVVELPYGLYPGLSYFSSDYGEADYRDWVDQSNGDPLPAPLAIYVQDFIDKRDKPHPEHTVAKRLDALERELRLQGALVDDDRPMQQFICAGRIATAWADDQLYQLIHVVQESFFVNQLGLSNWCACIGPEVPPHSRLRLLRVLGFSNVRFSLCVDPQREQSLEPLKAAIQYVHDLGMRLVSLDLADSETSDSCVPDSIREFLAAAKPDRIRLIGFTGSSYQAYGELLKEFDYHPIGLDWFVRAEDHWYEAKKTEHLCWSLLGFTEMPSPDVLGIGPGAVSAIGDSYSQNVADWQDYQQLVSRGALPVARGLELESDDLLRREIIAMILARSCIQTAALENKWGICFEEFFAFELEQLRLLVKRGWVDISADKISIRTDAYKELIELCTFFDHRARLSRANPKLSLV